MTMTMTMNMNERGQVAQTLFRFLERAGVNYCVVGDTRSYLEVIPGDIDIVVPARDFDGLARLVAQFCRENGVELVQLIRHEQTAVYFVLAWTTESGAHGFLAVDFCSDYFRRGRRLLSADEIVAQRGPRIEARGTSHQFYVPPPHVQFIYYLLKKIDKLELGSAHGEYLSSRWAMDDKGARSQVCRFWGPADADMLILAASSNDWSEVRAALPWLRRALRRAAPFSFAWLFRELRRKAARVLRPTGMTVAVLGPDGSGKSAVITRVLADLAPVFRHVHYLHLRPRLEGRRSGGAVTAPHAQPVQGAVASLAKLAWFTFDYVAGCALQVWPLRGRTGLIAFDRYFHDLLIDPVRYRYGAPPGFVRWVAKLVPEPDLWILLDAPAEVLQARKREMPEDEAERLRGAYAKFFGPLPNAAVIDAAQEFQRVAFDTEAAILRWMGGRLEYRYRDVRVEENPLIASVLLYFCRRKTPWIAKIFRILLNSDIYCRMPSPVLLPHPYGVIIHADSVIGRRVKLMQQVTLGAKDRGRNRAPILEDDVYVGAGAKILGAVRLGRGAIVGANAVVTKDVPPYCTVVGANRIVRKPGTPANDEEPADADLPRRRHAHA
jgi:serine acetyltransferase/thymidylate kinase